MYKVVVQSACFKAVGEIRLGGGSVWDLGAYVGGRKAEGKKGAKGG